MIAEHCYDIFYSQHMFQSHDCFGCFGLKNNAYCILNRQYEPDEYHTVKARMIEHMKETGEWGKYFPPQYSPFAWEDTNAAAVLISSFENPRDIAQRLNLRSEGDASVSSVSDALPSTRLPDRPDAYPDADVSSVWVCEVSGRPYKITKQELELFRRFRAPLPRVHWRVTFEQYYPLMYPMPYEARCGYCDREMYSSIRPSTTQRTLLCDACFTNEYS